MTDDKPNETDETDVCALCERPADAYADDGERGEKWSVEDDHALYSGFNLELLDDEAEASWWAHQGCLQDGPHRGDTYVFAMPECPDEPEAGEIRTVSATVNNGVLFASPIQRHDAVEPDSPELETIAAYVLETGDLPAEWTHQYDGVPDDAEWEQIGTGWHSSMEGSSVADRVNALTRGEVGIDGPVLVKFGQTRNVCSVGLTIHAPEGLTYWSKERHERRPFREYLEGSTSSPGGAWGTN